METLMCSHCRSEQPFFTEMKNGQNVARCNTCLNYIKNIPQGNPKFHIGKYKGKEIAEIEDHGYLTWAVNNMSRMNARTKQAIRDRIAQLEHLGR